MKCYKCDMCACTGWPENFGETAKGKILEDLLER